MPTNKASEHIIIIIVNRIRGTYTIKRTVYG